MRALLRRGAATARGLLRSGRLAFDLVDRTAAIDGRPLALPMKELAVLELLLLRAGKVVTKQSLFDRIYDPDEETMLNAIELYVSRLRRKLAPAGLRIRTIRGLGYLLEASPA
nr:winged helix-turn-helix domain-containing protein [Propylenella binzhouense]